jgi:PKD repeat protein
VKYNFYDTSLGSPNIRFWNFKNSSGKQIAYSSAKNAAFTFSKAGSYTVVLSVGKCSKGTWASCSSKCSKTVHVTVKWFNSLFFFEVIIYNYPHYLK